MKRAAIILLAAATVMAMALPATAKKPPKPTPEPEPPATYDVTITMTGEDGVETTCGVKTEMERTESRPGGVTHFQSTGAVLDIQATGLAFDDAPIEGCHGAAVVPEYFRITLDGDQVAVLWIFDVVVEQTSEEVVLKNGKVRIVDSETRTDLRMGGPYNGDDFAEWGHDVSSDGVVTTSGTGTFTFVQYDASRDPQFVPVGHRTFTLTITLDPNT